MHSECYINSFHKILFKTSILGIPLLYKLSSNPYEPLINIKCLDNNSKSFTIHSEYFPDNKNALDVWKDFNIKINGYILLNDKTILLEKYIPMPNQSIALTKNYDAWYYCKTDERNVLDISGPFKKETLIYILADKKQKEYFIKYKYNNREKDIYRHIHYRNLSDIT